MNPMETNQTPAQQFAKWIVSREGITLPVREKVIQQLSNLKYESDLASWGQQIYGIILLLPTHLHYEAFQKLASAPAKPGLFLMLSLPRCFEYFFGLTPEHKRLDALMVEDSSRVKLIFACFNDLGLLTTILEYLAPAQRLALLSVNDADGRSFFLRLLQYTEMIRQMVTLCPPTEIAHLCKQPHYNDALRSLINAVVIHHFQESKISQSILVILMSLNYRERMMLLNHKDPSGDSMLMIRPKAPDGCVAYEEMIRLVTSKKRECKHIVKKYRHMLSMYTRDQILVFSEKQMLHVLNLISLAGNLHYINKIDHKELEDYRKLTGDLLTIHNNHENQNDYGFSHFDLPNSLSSRLCYELLVVISEPDSLLELIYVMGGDIGLPSLCRIDLLETFPDGLSYRDKLRFFRDSRPMVELTSDLSALAGYPSTLEALSRLVFHDGVIVLLDQIHRYRFQRHIKLYQALREKSPGLEKAVYQHNQQWQTLEAAILTHLEGGLTPRQAIKHLILGLRRGGMSVTGRVDEADSAALIAITQFSNFYHSLPASLKQSLIILTLPSNEALLNQWEHLLQQGYCVQQLADLFQVFLDYNPNAPCLDQVVGVSAAFISSIEKMCRLGLSLDKDESVLKAPVPRELGRQLMQVLRLDQFQMTVEHLLDMPNALMQPLFEHVPDSGNEQAVQFFHDLDIALCDDFFTPEKQAAITEAIFEHWDESQRKEYLPTFSQSMHDKREQADDDMRPSFRS